MATSTSTTTTTKSTTKKSRGPRTARSATPGPAPRVRHMHDDAYWCESRSQPGTGHHTTPDTCTCPAGRWGRTTCWHRTFVRGYHAWRLEQQAARSERQTKQPTPQAPAVPSVAQQTSRPVALSSYFE